MIETRPYLQMITVRRGWHALAVLLPACLIFSFANAHPPAGTRDMSRAVRPSASVPSSASNTAPTTSAAGASSVTRKSVGAAAGRGSVPRASRVATPSSLMSSLGSGPAVNAIRNSHPGFQTINDDKQSFVVTPGGPLVIQGVGFGEPPNSLSHRQLWLRLRANNVWLKPRIASWGDRYISARLDSYGVAGMGDQKADLFLLDCCNNMPTAFTGVPYEISWGYFVIFKREGDFHAAR